MQFSVKRDHELQLQHSCCTADMLAYKVHMQ